MPVSERTEIEPEEIIPGRAFTDPAHTHQERGLLCAMIDTLCTFLERPQAWQARSWPHTAYLPDGTARQQRLVINHPRLLSLRGALTVVGFFGQKRSGEAYLPLRNQLDTALIGNFPTHPDLLSYCTQELPSGDYGNLVLFSRPEGMDHWRRCPIHTRAVDELAPNYYRSVRLYNGLLPGGLAASHSLRLTWVKYYDYSQQPPWRGVRRLET